MSIKPKDYKTSVALPKRSTRQRITESARSQSRTTRNRNGDRRTGVGLQTSFNGKRGIDLLREPEINKSTAFTEAEKQALGIVGLVPDVTETEDLQLSRVMMQLGHKSTDLDRYIYLTNLLDHDETLFYRTVMSDPVRFLPIVYDPTIGEACLKFGHIYRQPRGMYLSMTRRGKVKEILKNWPQKDVRFICVTDGGRILGLGDLGANGAAIPIGKLQLYTACAGVPPQYLMPMYLDAGTNNEQYLHDPLYLGMRKTRPSTNELYSFVDEFMEAVQEVFSKCCVHFEDWTGTDAVHLLQRYRDKYCVYNDDVQGTAGITLAGMINAAKLKGTKLKDEKYLFLGAGSAGIGLANLLCSALVAQGMTLKEAQSRVYMFDINGLLEATRKDLVDFQKPYAHQHAPTRDFVAAIESIKPTTIIGVSTIGGAFNQKVIESMSRINVRPVILALSNPTEHAECTAEQAYTWSKGKAIYAAGVQFAPVHYNGQTFLPGQANNFYIFPAVGMAIFATRAKRVTDEMFIEAGQAVADQVPSDLLKQGLLYPLQSNILEAEIQTAARVAKLVFDSGLARVERPADMVTFIRKHVYQPEYPNVTASKTQIRRAA
jgi:malate dehydrogenase (oxaloacetate-decarboxylating)(NADP+)